MQGFLLCGECGYERFSGFYERKAGVYDHSWLFYERKSKFYDHSNKNGLEIVLFASISRIKPLRNNFSSIY